MRLLELEPTSVEKRAAALRNAPKRSPTCCRAGLPARCSPPFLLSLSPDGLKVKACSAPLSLGLSSSFKGSLCGRNARRDHLLSSENKSCAETQQSSSRSQNNRPSPYLFTPSRNHRVCRTVNQTEEKCAECVSGVSVRVSVSEEAAVGLSKSPDALVWKL